LYIWLLSFESLYTRKVGGLAEVPPRLGEALQRRGHRVEVIVPSHGFAEKNRDDLKEITSFDTLMGKINIYEYDKPPIKHIIIGGGVLEEWEVYSSRYLLDKIALWSIGLKLYAEYLLRSNVLPNIIHGNDWHSVPGITVLKTIYDLRGGENGVKYYYQIHLLTRNSFSREFFSERLGIDLGKEVRGIYGWKTLSEYYDLSRGLADRLGALLSDKTLTVSREYMKDVVKRVGWDIAEHVDYIPNATTWSIEEVIEEVRDKHVYLRDKIRDAKDALYKRRIIREYFLKNALGNIKSPEPFIDNEDFKEYMKKLSMPPFRDSGLPTSFSEDGPLAIMTGRMVRQKGIHVLINAFEEIIYRVPEAKFVLLLLPVGGGYDLVDKLVEYTVSFPENLRVVFGRVPSIYRLAHLAADIMIAPSIYEPFGLMALEAMSTGAPVVASKTGGLAETVLDITLHGVKGTGLHVTPGDPVDLAVKTSDLLLFMESSYHDPWSSEWYRIIDRIENKQLIDLLLSNPKSPVIIRESCISRAKTYSWDRSAEKALRIYGS
jgi:glycogen synthase